MLKLLLDVSLGLLMVLVIGLMILVIVLRRISQPIPDIVRNESEKYYLDRSKGTKRRFPLVDSNAVIKSHLAGQEIYLGDSKTNSKSEIYLSIIIPAYNEQERLPVMLDEALEYLEARSKITDKVTLNNEQVTLLGDNLPIGKQFTYEIIIVDDGSNDKTTQVGLEYSDRFGTEKIRVLTLSRNRGKGGAVQLGVLSSRGSLILMADADGATKFSELEKLELVLFQEPKLIPDSGDGTLNSSVSSSKSSSSSSSSKSDLKVPNSIAIGSRAHLEQDAIASRSAFRTLLMHGFHFLVWFSCVRSVRDTQCGFKLFPAKIGHLLFSLIHVQKWAFDVELLYLCESLRIKINEVCVNWTEIDGSKIVPVFSWLQMGKDVLIISLMYTCGAWKSPSGKTLQNNKN